MIAAPCSAPGKRPKSCSANGPNRGPISAFIKAGFGQQTPPAAARFPRKPGADKVAVVGHEPELGDLAAYLLGSKKVHIAQTKPA